RDFRKIVSGHLDAFICCASFEKRSLSIAKRIPPVDVDRVIVVANVDWADLVHANRAFLCKRYGDAVIEANTRTDNPVVTADQLATALMRLPKRTHARVVVDISTFTHEQLLILLALLRTQRYAASTTLVYTGAAKYMLGRPKWLSRGVNSIR